MKTIAVGLSGGIDSGTTALKLKQSGYHVIGVTMWNFDHQTDELEAAKRVAEAIGIQHYILDYRDLFDKTVIKPFIKAYEQGFTPNPCIFCNKQLKYGKLIEDAVALGADYFATGHYVRCEKDPRSGEYRILKAKNRQKDQSYNLYHLSQETLSRLMFPIGEVNSKEEVRTAFSELSLELSKKKDSLGICFIDHKDHALYLKNLQNNGMAPGRFIDASGQLLGYHDGYAQFTIGQKRRLGKDLKGSYLNGRYVVTHIHSDSRDVVLGSEEDLLSHKIIYEDFHIQSPTLESTLSQTDRQLDVSVIVSQWSAVYSGKLSYDPTSRKGTLTFEHPVRAAAKGQALVCYDGEVLIGGGIIRHT